MLVRELKNILERFDENMPIVIKQDNYIVGIYNIELSKADMVVINGDE